MIEVPRVSFVLHVSVHSGVHTESREAQVGEWSEEEEWAMVSKGPGAILCCFLGLTWFAFSLPGFFFQVDHLKSSVLRQTCPDCSDTVSHVALSLPSTSACGSVATCVCSPFSTSFITLLSSLDRQFIVVFHLSARAVKLEPYRTLPLCACP